MGTEQEVMPGGSESVPSAPTPLPLIHSRTCSPGSARSSVLTSMLPRRISKQQLTESPKVANLCENNKQECEWACGLGEK